MQYKILIVKNRYSKTLDLKKGFDWFKANTPVEIVTEEKITDFDVTTEYISNASYKGVICGDDIYPKLRTVIPEGKYHTVIFVYGNNLNGIRVNVAKALPLYPGTDLIQLCTLTDGGKSANHEIFHTFIHRLQRQQVMIEDPMDVVVFDGQTENYFNDKNLDAKPSNRSIALDRIAPHWDKIVSILIVGQVPEKYTYFSESEVAKWKLKPELWKILDEARKISGTPFVITSGLRTTQENIDAGGKPNSSHLRGLAVDLLCVDNFKRAKMIRGILECGTDVFLEIAKKHLHIDIDASIHTMAQTIVEDDD